MRNMRKTEIGLCVKIVFVCFFQYLVAIAVGITKAQDCNGATNFAPLIFSPPLTTAYHQNAVPRS